MTFLPVLVKGQATPATPEAALILPDEPVAILAAARPLYDFTSAAMKPWHLKVNYQLYDEKSNPTEKGTYEYWWVSAQDYRSTWKRHDMEHTDWHVDHQHYSLSVGPPLPFIERKLQAELLTPLPRLDDLDPEKVHYEKREQSFGKIKLPCVMVIPGTVPKGQVTTVPFGLYPTYCFGPHTPAIRASYAYGATAVIYNQIAKTQDVLLAKDVAIFERKRKVLSATIDSVDGLSPKAQELVPPVELKPVTERKAVAISAAVANGALLKQVKPIYPEDAKQERLEGKVVLRAIIGADGHIHDLSVVEGIEPSLVAAAMTAVSQWEYRPYLLNGDPVDVDTTINVFFKFSR